MHAGENECERSLVKPRIDTIRHFRQRRQIDDLSYQMGLAIGIVLWSAGVADLFALHIWVSKLVSALGHVDELEVIHVD